MTEIEADENNVVSLVKGGRARCKIENETFIIRSKTKAITLSTSFGHGHQNLSMIFFVLNLLAFYVHQILELTDPLYHKLRYTKFTSRIEYWNQLRCTIRILIFLCWESLL